MTTTIKLNHPATKAFISALLIECTKQGLTPVSIDPTTESGLKENAGWAFLRFEGTHEAGASLIIPKAVNRLGNLHSHVDLSGFDGYVATPKKNGKVVCHFTPDVTKVAAVLKQFLSAAKRATATPVKKDASQVASAPASEAPVATPPSTEEGEAEARSWATVEETDEEWNHLAQA